MKIQSRALETAVQQTAGALLLNPVQGSTPAAQAQAQIFGAEAPLVAAKDARAQLQPLLEAFGFDRPEQLQSVTQADCLACSKSPMDAMALFALVVVVQAHLAPCAPKGCVLPPRKDPLPTLDVKAWVGDYEAARPVDPLILIVENVAPTSPKNPVKLFLVNRSDLHDPKPIELPANLDKAKDGAYSFQADEAWMRQHGIKPGAVLELYQVKYDEHGKETRRSEPTVVASNPSRAGLIPAPELPPGDVIGNIQPQANLRLHPDVVPTGVRPENIAAKLHDGLLTVTRRLDQPAFEPFTKLVAENLSTGAKSDPAEVKADGAFHLAVAAKHGEAVILRAVDHSHDLGDPLYQRKLVLRAGVDDAPMLVRNPAIGFDGAPQVQLGRVGLGKGKDCQSFQVDRGFTPGSVVTLARIPDQPGVKGESITGVAGPDGSLSLPMPFAVHAKDIFEVQVKNAYALNEKRHELQEDAVSTVRFEVNADGSLCALKKEGAVSDGADPVAKLDNTDRKRTDPKLTVQGFSMSFRPRDWNTGNGASLKVGLERRVKPEAHVRRDGDELVVTLRAAHHAHRDQKQETGVAVGFGAFGGAPRAHDNNLVYDVRNHMLQQKEGDRVAVRFEDEDGRVLARAQLETKWGFYSEGGHSIYINQHWGSVQTKQERYRRVEFPMVPGSLVHEG